MLWLQKVLSSAWFFFFSFVLGIWLGFSWCSCSRMQSNISNVGTMALIKKKRKSKQMQPKKHLTCTHAFYPSLRMKTDQLERALVFVFLFFYLHNCMFACFVPPVKMTARYFLQYRRSTSKRIRKLDTLPVLVLERRIQ